MSRVVIAAENLGKMYHIGVREERADSLTRHLLQTAGAPFRYLRTHLRNLGGHTADLVGDPSVLWALKDISFEVNEGEIVGIIGRNGAGKSTLLKILSRITKPTTGRLGLNGRINSLLEVGTGFHQELTGRENIYMNAAMHGMKRREIDTRLDEIIDFAEIEKFIDTPVKRYSSGMYTRLAFAVAAHLDPDILIVDEVLAVGDAAFQAKCLGKMNDVSQQKGRTVLFVSHQMSSIQRLCSRCLVFDQGRMVCDDDSSSALQTYLQLSGKREKLSARHSLADQPDDPVFRYTRVELTQEGIPPQDHIEGNIPVKIEVSFEVKTRVTGLRVQLDIRDPYETILVRSFHDLRERQPCTFEPGHYTSTVEIPAHFLGPADYELVVRATIFNNRTCSFPHGIVFPVNVIYNDGWCGPYVGDTFRAKLNPLLNWNTSDSKHTPVPGERDGKNHT